MHERATYQARHEIVKRLLCRRTVCITRFTTHLLVRSLAAGTLQVASPRIDFSARLTSSCPSARLSPHIAHVIVCLVHSWLLPEPNLLPFQSSFPFPLLLTEYPLPRTSNPCSAFQSIRPPVILSSLCPPHCNVPYHITSGNLSLQPCSPTTPSSPPSPSIPPSFRLLPPSHRPSPGCPSPSLHSTPTASSSSSPTRFSVPPSLSSCLSWRLLPPPPRPPR